MTTKLIQDAEPIEDSNAVVENALIEEYLKEHGYSHESLKKLPPKLVKKIMQEASQYASLKMEEVEARAHFIKELHEDAAAAEKV